MATLCMSKLQFLSALLLTLYSLASNAMGIRSFVALPLEKGGTVLRFLGQRNIDQNINTISTNIAYGLSGHQALFFGLPYRLSPAGNNRRGDLSVLYRHTSWQVDTLKGTSRLALLGGVVLPTNSERDGAVQAGAVATFYRKRFEWDLDVLWQQGLDNRPNTGRYDIAWQYRLSPASYPEWGIASEWDIDIELGGRWLEANTMVHQATIGLQYINKRWVAEVAVIQDLNISSDTRMLLSTRFHF